MIISKYLKITIIMPNYNGSKYLVEAIESFITQDYDNKELIIVDGKSTDESHEIISTYIAQYLQIKWLKYKDLGISDAINHALDYLDSDVVGYLGSDDLLMPKIFDTINQNFSLVNADAIYFNSYTHYINENKIILRKCPNIGFNRGNLIKFGTIVGLQNIFFKQAILEKYKFNINSRFAMDYEYYFNLVDGNYLLQYVDEIATINIFDANLSFTQAHNGNIERFSIARKNIKTNKELIYYYKSMFNYYSHRLVPSILSLLKIR
ncbi:MAG: glycosyltransferase [Burkholderiales bacterium]|nr:glycosyltransferase [Burkholderiales bacterium]